MMRAPRIHPIVLFFARWQRLLLHLLLVVATVLTLFPRARPAYAAAAPSVAPSIAAQTAGEIDPCDLGTVGGTPIAGCETFPPPELLYLESDIYFATAAQTASLRNLENAAVQGVLKLHSLPPTDEAAVRTWGRDAVLAELYVLLVKAINTDAAQRTADQQNAVDWVTQVAKRQNVAAAQNAAREYVKWAGLGRLQFDSLMQTNPSKAQIQAFLSGPVVNYDFPAGNAPGISTEGWCVYRSPAPYESEYTGFNNPLCSGPVLGFVLPPTPSYDQFVKWGQSKARYALLSSPAYLNRSQTLGVGLGVSFPVIVAAASAAPVAVALRAVAREAAIASIDDALSRATTTSVSRANIFSVASRFSLVAGATVALTVITALVTAVLLGINVTDAANLPGKLATLVDTARTTTPDASSLIGSTDAGTNLFSIFVGATTPAPSLSNCDNSNIIPGFLTFTIIGTDQEILSPNTPCLNPTRIPAAAATDPQFLVKNASGVETLAPTIAVKDNASGTVTTARLNNTWFITSANGTTAQTLRLAYTGWDGTQQSAWLTGTPTDGYTFLTVALDSSATTSAVNCLDDGTCGIDSTLKYIGADGQRYSATVRGYRAPTGTPTFSGATEGSPVVLDAGGFAPGGAIQPVTYRWSFKDNNCALVFGDCTPTELASVTDATFTYTWDTGGTYRVDLTATDAIGAQATTTLQVPVTSLPPAFVFAPDCATSPNVPCNAWSGDPASSVALLGTLRYTGSASRFVVTINWGDGSTFFATIGSDGSVGTIPPGGTSLLAVTRVPGELAYTIRVPYTYGNPGVYNGTFTVQKLVGLLGDGGTVSQPFTFDLLSQQSIEFPPIISGASYGDAFAIGAVGGGSSQPVTFSATGACTLSNLTGGAGTGGATVTVSGVGFCDITASQAGSTGYSSAPAVTRRFSSVAAPLTVTASSSTITYGDAAPAITPSYSGFKLSDSESTLTTPATCVVASNSGGVGSYATSCSGAIAPNYSTDYVPGTLTITRAPLMITANNKTMVYGQAVPSYDATFSGLVDGETSSVVSGLSCSARDAGGQPISSSAPIGSYPITCSGGSAANYSLSYVAGTLSINKAATTTSVSATPGSSLLGQAVTFTAAVAVTSPGSGTPGGAVTFLDGATPIAGCTAQPLNASGTATCTTSTLSVGQRAISASYSGDANFAASSATPASYTVAYGFSNFSGPVDNPPTVNSASAGRNIPLKWRIVNAAGAPITNLSSVTVTSAAGGCSANATTDPVEEYASTASGLQNLGDGYYQFNWNTERAWAGSCRTLRLNLGDGVVRTALFQFR